MENGKIFTFGENKTLGKNINLLGMQIYKNSALTSQNYNKLLGALGHVTVMTIDFDHTISHAHFYSDIVKQGIQNSANRNALLNLIAQSLDPLLTETNVKVKDVADSLNKALPLIDSQQINKANDIYASNRNKAQLLVSEIVQALEKKDLSADQNTSLSGLKVVADYDQVSTDDIICFVDLDGMPGTLKNGLKNTSMVDKTIQMLKAFASPDAEENLLGNKDEQAGLAKLLVKAYNLNKPIVIASHGLTPNLSKAMLKTLLNQMVENSTIATPENEEDQATYVDNVVNNVISDNHSFRMIGANQHKFGHFIHAINETMARIKETKPDMYQEIIDGEKEFSLLHADDSTNVMNKLARHLNCTEIIQSIIDGGLECITSAPAPKAAKAPVLNDSTIMNEASRRDYALLFNYCLPNKEALLETITDEELKINIKGLTAQEIKIIQESFSMSYREAEHIVENLSEYHRKLSSTATPIAAENGTRVQIKNPVAIDGGALYPSSSITGDTLDKINAIFTSSSINKNINANDYVKIIQGLSDDEMNKIICAEEYGYRGDQLIEQDQINILKGIYAQATVDDAQPPIFERAASASENVAPYLPKNQNKLHEEVIERFVNIIKHHLVEPGTTTPKALTATDITTLNNITQFKGSINNQLNNKENVITFFQSLSNNGADLIAYLSSPKYNLLSIDDVATIRIATNTSTATNTDLEQDFTTEAPTTAAMSQDPELTLTDRNNIKALLTLAGLPNEHVDQVWMNLNKLITSNNLQATGPMEIVTQLLALGASSMPEDQDTFKSQVKNLIQESMDDRESVKTVHMVTNTMQSDTSQVQPTKQKEEKVTIHALEELRGLVGMKTTSKAKKKRSYDVAETTDAGTNYTNNIKNIQRILRTYHNIRLSKLTALFTQEIKRGAKLQPGVKKLFNNQATNDDIEQLAYHLCAVNIVNDVMALGPTFDDTMSDTGAISKKKGVPQEERVKNKFRDRLTLLLKGEGATPYNKQKKVKIGFQDSPNTIQKMSAIINAVYENGKINEDLFISEVNSRKIARPVVKEGTDPGSICYKLQQKLSAPEIAHAASSAAKAVSSAAKAVSSAVGPFELRAATAILPSLRSTTQGAPSENEKQQVNKMVDDIMKDIEQRQDIRFEGASELDESPDASGIKDKQQAIKEQFKKGLNSLLIGNPIQSKQGLIANLTHTTLTQAGKNPITELKALIYNNGKVNPDFYSKGNIIRPVVGNTKINSIQSKAIDMIKNRQTASAKPEDHKSAPTNKGSPAN